MMTSPSPAATFVFVFTIPPVLDSADVDHHDADAGKEAGLGFHASTVSVLAGVGDDESQSGSDACFGFHVSSWFSLSRCGRS